MKGINSDSLDLLINFNSVKLDVLRENINNIKQSYIELKRLTKNQNINFLVSKTEKEIAQMTNVSKKLESYDQLLRSLSAGYKEELLKITNIIKHLIP